MSATAADRLRVPRSALLIELLETEREVFTLEAAHARESRARKRRGQNPSQKPPELTKIRDRRAYLLRALAERDAYILDAFARSLPASLRSDLYDTREKARSETHTQAQARTRSRSVSGHVRNLSLFGDGDNV